MRLLIHVGSPSGHLRPAIPLAVEWKSRGHELLVVAGERGRAETATFGLDFADVPEPTSSEQMAFRRGLEQTPIQERPAAVMSMFFRRAVMATPRLTEIVESWRPDVILRETLAWAAVFAGELRGIPVASFDFNPRPGSFLAPLIGLQFADFRKQLGLIEDPDLQALNRWLTLVGAPPEWFPTDTLPATAHLIRPPDPDPPVGESIDGLFRGFDDRPLVYATLGTTFNAAPGVWPMLLEGLATIDANVIATVGRDLDPSQFGPQPSNVRVVPFVSQALILPRSSAVLAHAGYGSLMGALSHGVPIVSVPLAATDNQLNAARLEKLGAGIAIGEESRSSRNVAAAVTKVLVEPTYRAAARLLAESIAALPTAAFAVDLLERLALQRHPILR